MNQSKLSKDTLPIAFGGLGALLFYAIVSAYRVYPIHDPGEYFSVAQRIHSSFRNGLFEGLSALYYDRCWKPVLQPLFALPFFAASGGKALPALHLSLAFLHALLAFFTFKTTRSIALTFFLLFNAATLSTAKSFGSEFSIVVCIVASFHYLSESNGLAHRKNAFLAAVWLGLGLCIRPAELVLFSAPAFTLAAVKAVRAKRLRLAALFTVFASALTCYVALLFYRELFSLPLLYIAVAALAALWHFRSKLRATPAEAAVALTFFAPVLWYGPFSRELWNWSWGSSFGKWASMSGNPSGADKLDFIQSVLSMIEAGLLAIGALVAAAFAFSAPKPLSRRSQNLPVKYVPLFASAALHLALGFSSRNFDLRYYFIDTYVLLLAVFGTALDVAAPTVKKRKIASRAFLALLCLHSANSVWKELGSAKPQDIMTPVAEALSKSISAPTQKNVKLRIGLINMESPDHEKVDAYALNMIALERGLPWSFDEPFYFNQSESEAFRSTREVYDYALLGPREGERRDRIPLTVIGDKYLKAVSVSKIGETGFTVEKELKFLFNGKESVYFLLKNARKDEKH